MRWLTTIGELNYLADNQARWNANMRMVHTQVSQKLLSLVWIIFAATAIVCKSLDVMSCSYLHCKRLSVYCVIVSSQYDQVKVGSNITSTPFDSTVLTNTHKINSTLINFNTQRYTQWIHHMHIKCNRSKAMNTHKYT